MSLFAAGFVLGLITTAAVVGGRGELVMAWADWLVLGLSVVVVADLGWQQRKTRLHSPENVP